MRVYHFDSRYNGDTFAYIEHGGSIPSAVTRQGIKMFIHWVTWPQEEIWDKVYPPEIEYLFSIALPRRSTIKGEMIWNYFPTTYKVEIHIYDLETIVAFKLKFGNDLH